MSAPASKSRSSPLAALGCVSSTARAFHSKGKAIGNSTGPGGSSGSADENHTVLAGGSRCRSMPQASASELTIWSPRPRGASAGAVSGVGKPSAVSVTAIRSARPPSISSTSTSNSVAACCTALVASSESMRAKDSATSPQSSGRTWQRKRRANPTESGRPGNVRLARSIPFPTTPTSL